MRWLVARGRTGQWGTAPFSDTPRRVAQMTDFAGAPGRTHIAESDGRPVGVLVVGTAPAHVPPAAGPELYVNLLVTDREFAGRGVGGVLVRHALDLAAARGAAVLRVDCYAGGDRALVRQYEALGFTATDPFTVESAAGSWPGQVLEIRLTE